jgi:putative endonuclease
MKHACSLADQAIVEPMHERIYFTYIMASRSRNLYTGITGNLVQRTFEHRQQKHDGFSAKYNCNRLVWFDRFGDVSEAIQREKELKGWTRGKKIALIETTNPTWEDLGAPWRPTVHPASSPTKAAMSF